MSREYLQAAAEECSAAFRIPTSLNRFGNIVIRQSDLEKLQSVAQPAKSLDPMEVAGSIPIETAPDWTFSPTDVALARLTAVVIRELRLRAIVRWLTRILTPKGNR